MVSPPVPLSKAMLKPACLCSRWPKSTMSIPRAKWSIKAADHRRRLREFEAALRSDMVASGKIANAALDCPQNACSVSEISDSQLLGKTRELAPPIC